MEKNKEGQFSADTTLAACKILLQPADTGNTHQWGGRGRTEITLKSVPFLSSIHYAWFCSILGARVYDLSGCKLAITPAELFTLQRNNLHTHIFSLGKTDFHKLTGTSLWYKNNVKTPNV